LILNNFYLETKPEQSKFKEPNLIKNEMVSFTGTTNKDLIFFHLLFCYLY